MNTELKKNEPATLAKTTENFRRPYYTVSGGKESYTVEVFMPGVAKGDYNVSLHRNELLVEGRKKLELPKGARWLHREITTEGYKLRLQLNVEVDSDEIKAASEEGILRITLPLAREARPRLIKIK